MIGRRVSINQYHDSDGNLVHPNLGVIVSMDGDNILQVNLDSGGKWFRPRMQQVHVEQEDGKLKILTARRDELNALLGNQLERLSDETLELDYLEPTPETEARWLEADLNEVDEEIHKIRVA